MYTPLTSMYRFRFLPGCDKQEDAGGRCLHILESMKGLIHLSFQLPSLKQLLVKFSQNVHLVRAVMLLVQGRPCQIKINRSTAVIETGGVRTWHNQRRVGCP